MNKKIVSVDLECAGTNVAKYSLISLAAKSTCGKSFYVEIKPINLKFDPKSMEINKLDFKDLLANGVEIDVALKSFLNWIKDVANIDKFGLYTESKLPIIVSCGLNEFSWLDYNLRKYVGFNPLRNRWLTISDLWKSKMCRFDFKVKYLKSLLSEKAFNNLRSHNPIKECGALLEIFDILWRK